MNRKVSEAKEDLEEKSEVGSDDISTRAHLQVYTSMKRLLLLQARAKHSTPTRQLNE